MSDQKPLEQRAELFRQWEQACSELLTEIVKDPNSKDREKAKEKVEAARMLIVWHDQDQQDITAQSARTTQEGLTKTANTIVFVGVIVALLQAAVAGGQLWVAWRTTSADEQRQEGTKKLVQEVVQTTIDATAKRSLNVAISNTPVKVELTNPPLAPVAPCASSDIVNTPPRGKGGVKKDKTWSQ